MVKMNDELPYSQRPPGEVERERQCMAHILGSAAPVSVIWEAFGGVGVTAGEMIKLWPRTRIVATELDRDCMAQYNATVGIQARCFQLRAEDFDLLAALGRRKKWAASLDFNRLTLSDLTVRRGWKMGLIERVMARKPTWVQLTDSAMPYLHLNWESYGLKSPDRTAYLRMLDRTVHRLWGMTIKSAACHHAAAYVLLVPSPKRLNNWNLKEIK